MTITLSFLAKRAGLVAARAPAIMPVDFEIAPALPSPSIAPADPTMPARESFVSPDFAARAPWQTTPRKRWSRRFRRLGFGGILLGFLISGFLYLSALFAPPRGVDFVLIGAGYETNLAVPQNIYGWNSLQDLASTIDEGAHATYWARHFWRDRPQPQRLMTESSLGELAPQTGSRNWVMFVAAHGGSDSQGAYLVADNDVEPYSGKQRVYLKQVLEHLKGLPGEQHKVLVLDTVHFECDVTQGMLTNSFAVELAKLDADVAAIPNLVIVCASGVDQLAWSCPMWGRTAFAHFWIEGMRGAAHDVDDDGRITLKELLDFAGPQTSHWVSQQYRAQQRPWILPQGREGERRAARMELAWRDKAYEPSTPTLVSPTAVPEALNNAWKTAAALHSQPVPPYVYQPQLWRRYLATLERYEQLVLAGEAHASQRLASEVQSLAVQCQHDPTQLLSSLDAQRSSNAFVQRISPQLRSQAQDLMQQLARTPPEQWADAWKTAYASAGEEARPLRAEVLALLVEQAISDPTTRLAPVRRLASIVRDPLQPHCPALHLAIMLERDLPPESRTLTAAPVIAHALRVRQLAEQATTGDLIGFTQSSPRVRAWVADEVAEGDRLRQEGEDLIFAGLDQFAAAEQRLTAAEQHYREAIARGHVVLNAYAVRDRALALLPDLSIGLLAFSRECADSHPAFAPLHEQAALAWQDVRALSETLASHNAVTGDREDAAALQKLQQQAERVSTRLDQVDAQLTQLWRELASDQASSERLCLTHIPSLPSLDVELRQAASTRLLKYLHRRREDLAQLLSLTASGHPVTTAAISRVDQVSVAAVQEQAMRRGSLALAMFGPEKFASLNNNQGDTWQEAQHRLHVFRVDANWRQSLEELGTQIGFRWANIPKSIDDLIATANAADGTTHACVLADDLARNMTAPMFVHLDDTASENLRRNRLSAYLAWQAERSWSDHWFSEHEDEAPYYAVRARALLADAQRVAPRIQAFRQLAQRLASNEDWKLQVPQKVATTPEEPLQLKVQLIPAPQERLGGFVSVRVALDNSLEMLDALGDASAWPANGSPIQVGVSARMRETPQLFNRTIVTSQAMVSAYYRGRNLQQQVALELHSTPEFAVVEPTPPPTAAIALETSPDLAQRFGRGSGAVAIVLDCSGSMGPKIGQPFDTTTRYAQATQTLDTVLSGLPEGSQLSLWTFGQAMGAQKTVKDAEDTVRCLRPLGVWNAADKAARDQLVKGFSYPAIEPWNESAVVHAMLAAKDELVKAQGSKTMIVITDGVDNRFEQDAKVNPRKLDVATGLAESFRSSGIAVNVVGFQVASQEEQAARDQFAIIESFDPPGRFFNVKESHELLAALGAALDQRLRFWIEDFDHRVLAGESSAGDSLSMATAALPRERVSATPGEYRLRVMAERPLERSMTVVGGDFLLAQLQAAGDQITVSRSSVLRRLYPQATVQHANGWTVGLLRTSLTENAATAEIALERDIQPNELQLAHVSPSQLWFECSLSAETTHPVAVRATRSFASGLPGWRVECLLPPGETLPNAVSGTLTGWWLEEDYGIVRPQLMAGRDFQHLTDLVGMTVSSEGEAVRIRDARWEPTEDGGRLMIVADGPSDSPLWIRLHDVAYRSSEHRHYRELSRYVGVFDVPLESLPPSGWRLEIFSLARMKRLAEERGTHAQFGEVLFQRASVNSHP